MAPQIELHPFKPFLPKEAKVVLCGTFPPKKDKWAMDFFYPNFYNDMWRIFGLLFFHDKEHFFDKAHKTIDKEGIKEMLQSHDIAIGETVTQAVRTKDNASDKFLEVIKPVNLVDMMSEIPHCEILATTGEKAASVIAGLTDTPLPKVGEYVEFQITLIDNTVKKIKHWRLPSSSRAYPMKMEVKASFYKRMFENAGIL